MSKKKYDWKHYEIWSSEDGEPFRMEVIGPFKTYAEAEYYVDDWRIGDIDSCRDEDGFLYSVPVYQIRKVVGKGTDTEV